ncbi:MAG: TonB-dependent receptor [Sphingomonas sp.]
MTTGKLSQNSRMCVQLLAAVSLSAITTGVAHAATAPVSGSAATADATATDGAPAAVAKIAATTPQATTEAEQQQAQDIVVTGFRQSLTKALNIKRDAVSSVDAIVAEDIAKFPDQNLADSLQRIPGISIERDGGEGRAITVRGLGQQFTQVRLNGLETVATSVVGESHNTNRGFDFNVFASELFTSLVVHKTAEAGLDEGSLGAVVDLNTGNPLAGKYGLTAVASAQGSYNTLAKDLGPRLTGLVSWKSPSGKFGASLSAAYADTDTLELGNNTVGWQQSAFNSVNGTPCFTQDHSGGTYVPSADCDAVALAFHPRIPRYMSVDHRRKRLGLTGALQWQPTDQTELAVDALYSDYKETRDQIPGEVLFRGNERGMDITDYTVDDNNNLISATVNNAYVRTEHYYRKSETEFYQFDGHWRQKLSDSFQFTLLGGISRSDAKIPIETTLMYDNRDATYSYDYSNMWNPKLTFGDDMTDPSTFQLAELRDRPSDVLNKFKTAQLRTEWDAAEGFKVEAGAMYRRFDFNNIGYRRDTLVCPDKAGGPDAVLGTITCSPSTATGPGAVYGFPVTSDISDLFHFGNAGQPSGTTTDWLVPDINKAGAFTHLYDREAVLDQGSTYGVIEKDTGGYLQFDVKGSLFGLDYAANAGTRFVHTAQSSSGYNSGTYVTVNRSYDDWLPALNIALYPTSKLIIRGAIAKVITRPSLGTLSPGGSVDSFNYGVSYGNPYLDPYRATNFDVSAEYYFAPQSLFSVALFQKNVASFPVSETRIGTFASTGLPTSLLAPGSPAAQNPEGRSWTIKSTTNGVGANLKGIEVQLQGPFRFLPGFLSHFGGIANATFISSNADYKVTPAGTVPNGKLGDAYTTSQTFYGLSKRTYNATLYYEDAKFSARASVAYRSPYVTGGGSNGNVFAGNNSTLNVDASVRYHLNDHIELSLDGINLTDEYQGAYDDFEADRNDSYNHYGRTIQAGVRFSL